MKIFIISLTIIYLALLAFILWIRKMSKGKHFCNCCHLVFIFGKKDRERTHCPYCGNELTEWSENDEDGE